MYLTSRVSLKMIATLSEIYAHLKSIALITLCAAIPEFLALIIRIPPKSTNDIDSQF
jgi:hypothetical protein